MIAKKSAALLLITLLAVSTKNQCFDLSNALDALSRAANDVSACAHTGQAAVDLHYKLTAIDKEFLEAKYPGYNNAGQFVRRAIQFDEKIFTISGLANKLNTEHQGNADWQAAIKLRNERRAQTVQPYCKELLASPLFSAIINSHHGIDVLTQCKATELAEAETKQDNQEVNA